MKTSNELIKIDVQLLEAFDDNDMIVIKGGGSLGDWWKRTNLVCINFCGCNLGCTNECPKGDN
jgi:hypothetical protein